MASYELTTIVGNVGKDAVLNYTPSGDPVCNFSVAVTKRWRKNGEQFEQTNWYSVSIFGALADSASQYIRKGGQVLLTGTVSARAYTDKSTGEAKATLQLNASFYSLLGTREHIETGHTETAKDTNDIPF